MSASAPVAKYLKDYRPAPFLIDRVDLEFDILDSHTSVRARMVVKRNPKADASDTLQLDGSAELVAVRLDGEALAPSAWTLADEVLTLPGVPESFILDIETRLEPAANTSLMGLYASNGNLYTQCEPEGFRKITYYLDRPDVMAKFSTTLIADRQRFPVLLSNGNKVGEGLTENRRRHWVKWVDPYRKPAYLFAVVAGKLSVLRDHYTTRGGRKVTLEIYVAPADMDKTAHAMSSLKKSMQWDEQVFGLEYDLDTYMIVAVGDFNMGAMENKGLNIFNTKFVLANRETATDFDFEGVEAVIAHEYFHNWTGNRVTCRDWFQLSLKEGLTVFRDQEFSADMQSRAVKRIEDARGLRALQFPEDAGPTAHPVRPESYIEMNNFYTLTVYEKGAEVVRMIHTLVGAAGFRQGMDLYFRRHDGQAVTCEDFVAAMADANHIDLTQFKRWYSQAGTPVLDVSLDWFAEGGAASLTVRQHCPDTPGQTDKLPFHIPLAVGLLAADGSELPVTLASDDTPGPLTRVLSVTEAEQTFTFVGLNEKPLPSLLRNFSAPVRLNYAYRDEELAFLCAHDSDAFNRWEAGQTLATRELLRLYRGEGEATLSACLIDAFAQLLDHADSDPAFAALALTLPADIELLELQDHADPARLCQVREQARAELAQALAERWDAAWRRHSGLAFRHEDAGRRALKNLALSYLALLPGGDAGALASQQYQQADNMTDRMGALAALADSHSHARDTLFADFAQRFADEALVMDKWFTLQAGSRRQDVLRTVTALMEHPAFALTNPNKVRALIGAFGRNLAAFHAADGSGYRFMADQVLAIDAINPQVASRLVSCFNRRSRVEPARAELMRVELARVLAHDGLSRDVYEIVSKNLNA